ncbi:hypothetical protein B0T17DRAFT_501626 [Bombardia bombarda]|uniref:RRM domain-containing protein n=1 Tax=Bombardia bombarda TaxID=252184 RepID=A0AA39WC63_9PEZI|nr:hypothetical protein B0T17DRAFT_501626 [Bombardia bombarda]
MELQNVASAKINKPVKGILRPAKSLSDVVENGINNANRSAAKDPSSSRSVRFRDIPGDDESPTKAGKSPIKWGPTSYLPEYSYDQGKDFDAQGVYPPTACVFVANLPEPKDDMALEAAIVREFTKYGTVFVKIRRDAQNMPFAFCQFTRNEDANIAMEQGKGTMILGRPCRTEMVKANRSFVIYKRHGGDITVDEARLIMGPYGELSKCELLHTQVQEALGISPAVLAVFQKFDPTRDLNAVSLSLSYHPNYCCRGEFHIDAFDVKKKGVNSREDDRELLKQHEISCRSVYVTFLPADTDKREISDFFGQVGEVLNVDLIKKFVPSPQGK